MPHQDKASRPGGPVSRRSELRRKLIPERGWLRSPVVVQVTAVATIFAILAWVLASWSRQQHRHFEGQIATAPILNGVEYQLENEALTRQQRDLARRNAPRVYETNRSYLDSIRAAIEGLPQAVAEKTSITEVRDDLVKRFSLKPEALVALQKYHDNNGPTEPWKRWTDRFVSALEVKTPIVTRDEFQKFATATGREVILPAEAEDAPIRPPEAGARASDAASRGGDAARTAEPPQRSADSPQRTADAPIRTAPMGRAAIELPEGDPSSFRTRLFTEAVEAGFPTEAAGIVVNVLVNDPQPTERCEEKATLSRAEAAANAVRPVLEAHPRGEVIAMVGDPMTHERMIRMEEAQAQVRPSVIDRWSHSLGLLGLCVLLAACLCVGLSIFRPDLLRDIAKLSLLLTALLLLAFGASVFSASFPRFTVLACMGVLLFAAASIALLYDRRTALIAACCEAGLLALSLEESPGFLLATLVSAGTYIALLRDIRHRAGLVRATGFTGIVAAVAVVSVGLVQTPLSGGGFLQIFGNAVLAAVGALITGFLLVGLLPTMERTFGVVTGLTLAELRDPRQALLRQLQQKAPGTWNHSLQVANIAESAADSIGADGLLTYVGALYHDIGKMNKPDYFVENQHNGENRHEKLNPAMSLLIIVGHVKDGVELANEYRLPRAIRHFIESHHGTTLVEYFFHEAQRRAELAGEEADEVEDASWRYPGPRPQTREAAILMVADAVESATRALQDPTPARIEQLVRSIARRRLEDGQFDECPMSFREIRAVEESLSKSLCAIYHGRISYPSTADVGDEEDHDAPEPRPVLRRTA